MPLHPPPSRAAADAARRVAGQLLASRRVVGLLALLLAVAVAAGGWALTRVGRVPAPAPQAVGQVGPQPATTGQDGPACRAAVAAVHQIVETHPRPAGGTVPVEAQAALGAAVQTVTHTCPRSVTLELLGRTVRPYLTQPRPGR